MEQNHKKTRKEMIDSLAIDKPYLFRTVNLHNTPSEAPDLCRKVSQRQDLVSEIVKAYAVEVQEHGMNM